MWFIQLREEKTTQSSQFKKIKKGSKKSWTVHPFSKEKKRKLAWNPLRETSFCLKKTGEVQLHISGQMQFELNTVRLHPPAKSDPHGLPARPSWLFFVYACHAICLSSLHLKSVGLHSLRSIDPAKHGTYFLPPPLIFFCLDRPPHRKRNLAWWVIIDQAKGDESRRCERCETCSESVWAKRTGIESMPRKISAFSCDQICIQNNLNSFSCKRRWKNGNRNLGEKVWLH